MWYKNIARSFFGLVTKYASDGQTDGRRNRITTPKTALASLLRAVKTVTSSLSMTVFGSEFQMAGAEQRKAVFFCTAAFVIRAELVAS